jgi:hypothetical protein
MFSGDPRLIPGNSVQDANPACRSEPDDASRSGATAGYDTPLQDIQHIIDELAAVTKKLRHPGDRLRDPLR